RLLPDCTAVIVDDSSHRGITLGDLAPTLRSARTSRILYVTGMATTEAMAIAKSQCDQVREPAIVVPMAQFDAAAGLDYWAAVLPVLQKGIVSDLPWMTLSIRRRGDARVASPTEVLSGLASMGMFVELHETCPVAGTPPKFKGCLKPTAATREALEAELAR